MKSGESTNETCKKKDVTVDQSDPTLGHRSAQWRREKLSVLSYVLFGPS